MDPRDAGLLGGVNDNILFGDVDTMAEVFRPPSKPMSNDYSDFIELLSGEKFHPTWQVNHICTTRFQVVVPILIDVFLFKPDTKNPFQRSVGVRRWHQREGYFEGTHIDSSFAEWHQAEVESSRDRF